MADPDAVVDEESPLAFPVSLEGTRVGGTSLSDASLYTCCSTGVILTGEEAVDDESEELDAAEEADEAEFL